MFLKEVHLTRNHWSFRLLTFVFPSLPRFSNFCPHFWLTLLAIIVLPFKLLGLLLAAGFNHVVELGINLYGKHVVKKGKLYYARLIRVLPTLTDVELALVFHLNKRPLLKCSTDKFDLERLSKDYDFFMSNLNTFLRDVFTKEQVATLQKYHAIATEKYRYTEDKDLITELQGIGDYRLSLKRKKERRKLTVKPSTFVPLDGRPWWGTAIKISKYLSLILGVIGISLAVYLLYGIIVWLWENLFFDYTLFIDLCAFFSFFLGFISFCFFIGSSAFYLQNETLFFEKLWCLIQSLAVLRYAFSWLVYLGYPFSWSYKKILAPVGRSMVSVIIFFVQGFKMLKADNCPPIIWEDDKE